MMTQGDWSARYLNITDITKNNYQLKKLGFQLCLETSQLAVLLKWMVLPIWKLQQCSSDQKWQLGYVLALNKWQNIPLPHWHSSRPLDRLIKCWQWQWQIKA